MRNSSTSSKQVFGRLTLRHKSAETLVPAGVPIQTVRRISWTGLPLASSQPLTPRVTWRHLPDNWLSVDLRVGRRTDCEHSHPGGTFCLLPSCLGGSVSVLPLASFRINVIVEALEVSWGPRAAVNSPGFFSLFKK